MTIVTGTLGGPVVGSRSAGLVTFFIVDSEFRRARNARTAAGTLVEPSVADLTAGAYSQTLTPQSQIVFPEGSKTARQHGDSIAYLEVPDTGTHDEATITVPDPLSPVPPVALTSIIDRKTVTGGTSPLTVQFTSFTLVPNTSITVPNLSQSVLLRGHGPMKPSITGGAAMAIVPAGVTTLGSQLETFWLLYYAANNDLTATPEVILPPNSPGSYQLAFYGATGTILFDVSLATVGSLTAYAV